MRKRSRAIRDTNSRPRSLEKIMSDISHKAQERGLTEQVLNELLDDQSLLPSHEIQ